LGQLSRSLEFFPLLFLPNCFCKTERKTDYLSSGCAEFALLYPRAKSKRMPTRLRSTTPFSQKNATEAALRRNRITFENGAIPAIIGMKPRIVPHVRYHYKPQRICDGIFLIVKRWYFPSLEQHLIFNVPQRSLLSP